MKTCGIGLMWVVLLAHPAPAQMPACAGDCNGDGRVTVDELITLIRIPIRLALFEICPEGDSNGDGETSVNEIVGAVNNALEGCPPLWMQIIPCRQCEPCDVLLNCFLGGETLDEAFACLMPDGVILLDRTVEPVGITCTACGCPNGSIFRALVRACDKARLLEAGWEVEEHP